MIYLDNGATSLHKPVGVADAIRRALFTCGNPGRGGHRASMTATKTVLDCRVQASRMFDCRPEEVVFTANCTHGLNMAIRTLVRDSDPVVITGFEHNAVTRPLHALGAQITVAGRRLFDWDDTLENFEKALKTGPRAAIFTHCSNVFGYILPVEEMALLCRQYDVPFIVDAAQSAGVLPVGLHRWGAAFVAMPGHKGLLGPQGTGLLLCGMQPQPILQGGTGSDSVNQQMPDFLPDVGEAGTLNVPGIAGLSAGLSYLEKTGIGKIFEREQKQAKLTAEGLKRMGFRVFYGPHSAGTVSFQGDMDCEEIAKGLSDRGIAVRAGLHCAPLAHESAGTLKKGTVRVSFGHDASRAQTEGFLTGMEQVRKQQKNFQ